MDRVYIAIDLKSFYASVECVQRGLDPMNANLVVADPERTEKTICLAVSPSLKRWGIPGRPRLFEVVQKVAEVNALRRQRLGPGYIAPEIPEFTVLFLRIISIHNIIPLIQLFQYNRKL